MADTKITALTALTAADPANDVIPIVDVSDTTMAASGTTKKISVNNILGASGTATLASATITGALGAAGLNVTGATIPANGVYLGSANNLSFSAASTLGMTLNSTGLGVGVTPSAWTIGKIIQLGAVGGAFHYGASNQAISGINAYFNSGWKYAATGAASNYEQSTGAHLWYNSPSGTAGNAITFTQAMTLDASGRLLVGTTDAGSNSGIGLKAAYSATAPYFSTVGSSVSASDYSYLLYSTGGTPAFKFYVSYSGTVSATSAVISAISDARLKENVQDIDVGLGAILALKPRKFDWKEGRGKNIKGDRGFIAQEFETVFPNLIDEWKDPAPEGEAPYKSVRADLIPVLVKAIQELTARVQTLEAR